MTTDYFENGFAQIFVPVPVAMKQAEHQLVKEGDDVEVYCNVTGIPDPTAIWTKVQGSETTKGILLNITNITRDQAGDYRCTANNTCGEESTVVNIDVLCKNNLFNVKNAV